jgi:myb proto-oncogene protein
MIPTAFPTPEPAPTAPAPNHSGSISQHSSDDQDHSNLDLGMDHLPVIGSAGSSEQDWGLDGACQWNNMSSIC